MIGSPLLKHCSCLGSGWSHSPWYPSSSSYPPSWCPRMPLSHKGPQTPHSLCCDGIGSSPLTSCSAVPEGALWGECCPWWVPVPSAPECWPAAGYSGYFAHNPTPAGTDSEYSYSSHLTPASVHRSSCCSLQPELSLLLFLPLSSHFSMATLLFSCLGFSPAIIIWVIYIFA